MELFENVHKLISETNTKAAVEAKEELMGPSTYKYVSRPVRLVMNRPLFRENAIVMMAAKLGDYLAVCFHSLNYQFQWYRQHNV